MSEVPGNGDRLAQLRRRWIEERIEQLVQEKERLRERMSQPLQSNLGRYRLRVETEALDAELGALHDLLETPETTSGDSGLPT